MGHALAGQLATAIAGLASSPTPPSPEDHTDELPSVAPGAVTKRQVGLGCGRSIRVLL